MLIASGLNYGIRRTIPHAFGIILGVPIITLALGFGKLFIFVPELHQLIKIVGILYLLYLAWRIGVLVRVSLEPYFSGLTLSLGDGGRGDQCVYLK